MSEEVAKLIQQGQAALEKGNFKGAMTKFNKVIKLDPDSAEAHFGKAEASVGLPKLSLVDVAGFYRKAIELSGDNPFFLTSYGEFCLSHGLLPQAEQQYQRAVEVDPDGSQLYYSDLALGYFLNGLEFMDRQLEMTEEDITRNALGYYLKAFGADGEAGGELLTRVIEGGEALTTPDAKAVKKECDDLGCSDDENIKALLMALKDEPNNPMTMLSLGQAALESGFINAGMHYFMEAIAMDEENAPFFWNDLSMSLYSAGMSQDGGEGAPDDEVVARSFSFALNALGYLEGERARELISRPSG